MTFRAAFLLSITLTLFTQQVISAGDVAIKDLPEAVVETIKARYPKGEMTEAKKIVEDSKDVYEVSLTDGGKEIEIAVFPDGKIDWVAIDIALESLPKKVLMAVRKKYPAAKLNHASSVYTVEDGKDHLEHYAVELTQKNGKKRELDVTPAGEIEDDVEVK